MGPFWSFFKNETLDPSYRSIFLGIPSDKKPKGQKNIFGDFMIAPPIFGQLFAECEYVFLWCNGGIVV